MIIIENRFEEMIDVIPEMKGINDEKYKVHFSFGDDKELNSFLARNRRKTYPLIWLVYPFNEKHSKNKVKIDRLTFILAVETNTSALNKERFKLTYETVLFPLFDNFKELLDKSNITNLNDEIDVIKFPNYSNEKLPGNRETLKSSEKHKTLDVWDALKVTITNLTITDNCFRKNIKFRSDG